MRRTDFCHLTSSYEHPRPVGLRCVTCLRTCHSDNRLLHISAIRFGGPHVHVCAIALGLVFPSRCVVAEPLTSLSPLSLRGRGVRTLRRAVRAAETVPAHPRERCAQKSDPRCLPSHKNLCPATPSRASGSGLPRLRGLATAMPVVDAFSPHASFECVRIRSPCTRPVASGNRASYGPRPRLPTSAT